MAKIATAEQQYTKCERWGTHSKESLCIRFFIGGGGGGGRELWADLQHTHRHTELSRVIETMAQYACTILFDINNSKNLFWNIRFIIITIQTLTEHSKYINIILDSL